MQLDLDEKPKDLVSHIENRGDHQDANELNDSAAKARGGATGKVDDAAEVIAAAGGQREISAEERKRVLRIIDLWVCVPMCIVYTVQSMDKASISYASVFDLIKATHLKGTEFSWLSSCGYVAQLIFQMTSAYALVVFPVKYWVMFNMTSWTITTICTAAATSFKTLLICRIILGIFEATILPSFGLIIQMWWTRREQAYRTVAYQVALSLSGIIGPLMSYGIGQAVVRTHSSLHVYQAIFLFIGSLSLAFVPLIWWMLPNSPTTAKCLRHGDDRLIALERLRENNTGTKASKWKWPQFWEAMRDPKTWMWTVMLACVTCPQGGIGTFGGLITEGFGFSPFQTILMQIPTGVIGILSMLVGVFVINRIRIRWIVVCAVILPAVGGAIGLIYVPRSSPGGLMGCFYPMYIYGGLQPLVYAWANINAAGTTKRVVTTATLFVGMCVGNIVGPQVYLTREAPYYHSGLYTAIGCWSTLFLLCIAMRFYLKHLNRKQAKRRGELGLPEDILDMSIMPLEEASQYRERLTLLLRDQGVDEKILYEEAFDDMTDFQNPMFIYVI